MRTPREIAQYVLNTEARALVRAVTLIGPDFEDAVRCIVRLAGVKGKLVTSGLGKSGIVAQKVAGTFASTGVPSIFVHPVDAMHGDIGNVNPADVVLLFSASGQTEEVLAFLIECRRRGGHTVAIVGNPESPIAAEADYVIDASVEREASLIGLIPTASSTTALALGDALAMAVMAERGFTRKDLAENHPSGTIGRGLTTLVRHLMHGVNECAAVTREDTMGETILQMTSCPLGAALVLDGPKLVGLVTEGDLRRALQRDPLGLMRRKVSDFMTTRPRVIEPDILAIQALELMEASHPVYVLPVVAREGDCLGLIRMHDIVQAGLRSSPGLF